MDFVELKLTQKHLEVIQNALEVYYRLKTGQVSMALDQAYNFKIKREDSNLIEDLIKKIQFPELMLRGSGWSFNSKQIGDASVAYEIKKTVEEYLSVKNNDGFYGQGVNFNGPLKATDGPLPEIVGFKKYKDYPLTRGQSRRIFSEYISQKKYSEMWDYIKTLNLNLPKCEKMEVIPDENNCIIRVWKPRKD